MEDIMAKRQKKTEEEMIIYDNNGREIANYPPKLIDVIKNTVAKDSTDEELYMFMQIASMYGLNPFMKEIWFVKNKDGSFMIMTSRDGYLTIAKQNPKFSKCQSMAVYENDDFEVEMTMGEVTNITHKFKQTERGKLIGAYAVLKTTDHNNLMCYVPYKEYAKNTPVWRSYPSAMIRKVAENDVLKRFADINGIQTVEDAPVEFQKASSEFIDVEMKK